MNYHRAPIVLVSFAICMASILLRPIYPKSVFVGLLIGCVVFLSFACLGLFKVWNRPSTSKYDTPFFVTLLLVVIATSLYGMYLTLWSIFG